MFKGGEGGGKKCALIDHQAVADGNNYCIHHLARRNFFSSFAFIIAQIIARI